jgi:hypothetical protein
MVILLYIFIKHFTDPKALLTDPQYEGTPPLLWGLLLPGFSWVRGLCLLALLSSHLSGKVLGQKQ